MTNTNIFDLVWPLLLAIINHQSTRIILHALTRVSIRSISTRIATRRANVAARRKERLATFYRERERKRADWGNEEPETVKHLGWRWQPFGQGKPSEAAELVRKARAA